VSARVDGIPVSAGQAGDTWAVQTYTPRLPRGMARRAVRTYATRAQAEHAAARHRGRGVGMGAWVTEIPPLVAEVSS